jgi:putative transposase
MYARHRFPTEIISYAVWLYFTFPLSYMDVQKLLLDRGIDVSHEAIRAWCQKFGQQYANEMRHRRPRVGDKWHLDEMVVTINAEQYYL